MINTNRQHRAVQRTHLFGKHQAFTLVELLITVTISLLLASMAIGTFLEYLDKKTVNNTVDELKTFLQRAEADAATGSLGGCDQLAGYRVTSAVVGSTIRLSLQPDCVAGTPDPAVTYDFKPGITLSPAANYNFRVLHAGVDLPGGVASIDITVANETNSYLFTLYREGRFSEGAWQ